MGLAFVAPIAGYVGYWLGSQLDGYYGTRYGWLIGVMLGTAAGIYEVVKQAIRIESRK